MRSISSRRIIKLLLTQGWVETTVRGSHYQFKHAMIAVALTDEDKQWIAGQLEVLMEHIDEHIDERTHDVETRLLRAFAGYNTAADTRFRKLEADASNLNTSSTIRLGELERQMSELQAKVILIEGRLPK